MLYILCFRQHVMACFHRSLEHHTDELHCPKNFQCFACSSLYPTLGNQLLVLFFCHCHSFFLFFRMSYIWNYTVLVFSGWLLLLSNMHLSFLCVFLWLDSSFLFSAEKYSIICMYCIYLTTYWGTSWLLTSFGNYE